MLSSCGNDKIKVWKEQQGQWFCAETLDEGHKRTIRSVSFSPDSKKIASASFDATVGIWERKMEGFELVANLEGHENEVKSAAWSASGALLATCSRDKSVWIWEVEADNEFECVAVLQEHTQDVKQVLWHPFDETLVSCSYDDTLKVWREDGDDWYCSDTLSGHESTVWAAAFSPSGEYLASCGEDKTIKIWKAYPPGNTEGVQTNGKDAKWKDIGTLQGFHTRSVYSVSWSSGDLLASGSGDNSICIFSRDPEVITGEPAFILSNKIEKAHKSDVNCVKWNPAHPDILASCSDDGTIKIWKVQRN